MNEKLGNRRRGSQCACRKRRDLWQERVTQYPTNREYARNLALSQNNLGLAVAEDGRLAEALELLDDGLRIADAVAGGQSELVRDCDRPRGPRMAISGWCCVSWARAKKPSRNSIEAIAILEPLAKSTPTDEIVLRSLAASYNNLASLRCDSRPSAVSRPQSRPTERLPIKGDCDSARVGED